MSAQQPSYRSLLPQSPAEIIAFFAQGICQAQGSKAIGYAKNGRAFVREQSVKVYAWRKHVRALASQYMHTPPEAGPVRLCARFTLLRPVSHLKKNGALRASAPLWPRRKDLSKLVRAVEDALTGVVYDDDSQIVEYGEVRKLYVTSEDAAGCLLRVEKV